MRQVVAQMACIKNNFVVPFISSSDTILQLL